MHSARSYSLYPFADYGATAPAAKEVNTHNYDQVRFDISTGDITTTGTGLTFTVEFYDIARGAWVTLRDLAAANAAVSVVIAADNARAAIVISPRVTAAVDATDPQSVAVPTITPGRIRITPSFNLVTKSEFAVMVTLRD